jgi:hypothetical protein
VSFYVQTPNGIVGLTGSSMAYSLRGATEEGPDVKRVMECRVLAVSIKGKITVKAKLVGRRLPTESRFLDDLVIFLARSGTCGKDELFSFRLGPNPKVALTSFVVRKEVKSACDRAGLPSKHFSSHSLRKGGVTHMRASGACEDDRRDRGNWAPGSQVMNGTYDYGHGLGPLAAESLTGGYLPSVTDVQRILPVLRGQRWQYPWLGRVKDTSILDPLSPARTKILQGNRSRGAGQDLKWQGSVATCKLKLRRLISTLSLNSRLRPVPLGTNGGEQFSTSSWGRTTHRPLTPGAERNKTDHTVCFFFDIYLDLSVRLKKVHGFLSFSH